MQLNSMKQTFKNKINNYFIGNFYFIPNIKPQVWEIIRRVIGDMILQEHHSHNSNMKCHDLCTIKSPP